MQEDILHTKIKNRELQLLASYQAVQERFILAADLIGHWRYRTITVEKLDIYEKE